MKLSYPSKVLLALLCISASVSMSAQKPVYLPVPSERLVQALEYIYFALDDGNTSGEGRHGSFMPIVEKPAKRVHLLLRPNCKATMPSILVCTILPTVVTVFPM